MKNQGILGGLHPFLKLLLLLIIMIASVLVVMFAAILLMLPFTGAEIFNRLGDMSAENLNVQRYMQVMSHIGLFIIPSVVFAMLIGRNFLKYYNGETTPNYKGIVFSALIIITVIPLVYYLMQLNQQMSLPESMSRIEKWMRQAEDTAEILTKTFLNVNTIPALLFNLFMISVIPAIGEELIFRGAVQKVFHQWTKNIHVAVIIAAFIFSAMHLQFYGFLPRFVLGILLGYMFVLTGNIWVPIFAHFFNNALGVILYYIAYNSESIDPEAVGSSDFNLIMVLLSASLVMLLMIIMKNLHNRKELNTH